MNWCPHCGGLLRGSEDQVARWRAECAEDKNKWPIVAGRVSEATAAKLLGMSARKLADLRKRGCSPMVSLLPVAGSRFSYELEALSRFKDAMQTGEDWQVLVA